MRKEEFMQLIQAELDARELQDAYDEHIERVKCAWLEYLEEEELTEEEYPFGEFYDEYVR